MKTPLAFVVCMVIGGCAYHAPLTTVYGRSGASFVAPDLCGALTKCLNSAEVECYYNAEIITNAVPNDPTANVVATCKAVKK